MSHLFTPFQLRDITFKNRIFVAPMCMYSSENGMPNHWHTVHLGSRAVGGAGLVMTEATAVNAIGRITPTDAGICSDAHAEAWAPITVFIKSQGSVPAIQLAHAGRKASHLAPWLGGGPVPAGQGDWETVAPSAVPFDEESPVPRALTLDEIDGVVADFVAATERSLGAGFEVIEIHAAHGYLLHQFLSPFSNHRTDEYGGSLENRMRLPLRVAEAVRAVLPTGLPLFVRISATDWKEGGWDLEQSVELSKGFKALGVDLVDCSSGGAVPDAKMQIGPGYQVPFAETIRREAGIATGAVGLITEPEQAEEIVASEKADVVLLAREMLRDPYWPLHAARVLGDDVIWPVQYERSKPR